jgi:L-ascorbate metabolism protein UlaG (beta-lactamase superfamily)
MLYRALADAVLLLHLGFIVFVTLGGLLVLRWPRLAALHIPAALWGALIEFTAGQCPLTPLEQWLRHRGGETGYAGGFIEHYLTAAIYPEGLTREMQLALGTAVVLINAAVYWRWWRQRTHRSNRGTGYAGEARLPGNIGFLAAAAFFGRRIRLSLSPRSGAAGMVPFDPTAMAGSPSITWVGHSTFLVRMDGATFLTDPMFSERASPFTFTGPRRSVPPGIPLVAVPPIDFVLLSHDHYDHADRPSIRAIGARGTTFVVPPGLGEWVEREGCTAVEVGWWQSLEVQGVTIQAVPARHFSGRSPLDRNRRWCTGWIVSGPSRRFYFAGDTGYAADFATIGQRLGPIDLAAVPIGAYLPAGMMHPIHTTPEEAVRLGLDAGARRLVAMHFGTFDLADEPMDEPARRFRAEAERLGLWPDRAWLLKVGETRDW